MIDVMILRRLCIFSFLIGFNVNAHRSTKHLTNILANSLTLSNKNHDLLYLRGGGQSKNFSDLLDNEEENLAFVSNNEAHKSKTPLNEDAKKVNGVKETSSRLSVEINKNLRERFSDASVSLQNLMELQKMKPKVMNISNEMKIRYGETVSKLYKLKLASMLQMQSIKERVEKRYNIHLDYSVIKKVEQTMISAKNWMKDGTLGALGSDASYMLLATLALSSLGASLGFASFLYFVSVGYGASIGIVAASALIISNFFSKKNVPVLTNVHTGLALLWSFRLIIFLLHREYINWPEWHEKLLEVDGRANAQSRITIWMTCSVFYAMMMTPCINRMKEAMIGTKISKWGKIGKCGIYLQGGGLLLETLADYQKGRFKHMDGNRNRFCNIGVWTFFSHPNYLGEIVFWVGTFLGGVACNHKLSDWTISIAGLLFIITVMKGASDSLDSKHIKNYGHNQEYMDFRRKRCFFGPIPSLLQRKKKITNIQQYSPTRVY